MSIFYEGIILKVLYYREDDRIIKIFTRNGIISVVGRSIKKGKRANLIDIGNYIRFNIIKGKKLNILTSVTLIDSFYIIKEKNPFYIFYVCEVLSKIQREGQDESNIFEMVLFVFFRIKDNPKLALIFFNIHLLNLEGSLINLEDCFVCKRKLEKDFSFSTNGISHIKCFRGDFITGSTLHILREIYSSDNLNMHIIEDDGSLNKALLISMLFIENFLEHRINSKEYILKGI